MQLMQHDSDYKALSRNYTPQKPLYHRHIHNASESFFRCCYVICRCSVGNYSNTKELQFKRFMLNFCKSLN